MWRFEWRAARLFWRGSTAVGRSDGGGCAVATFGSLSTGFRATIGAPTPMRPSMRARRCERREGFGRLASAVRGFSFTTGKGLSGLRMVARAAMTFGTHCPSDEASRPAGQLPHAGPVWCLMRASKIASGLSAGSFAFARSTNAAIALRVCTVQKPLIAPS